MLIFFPSSTISISLFFIFGSSAEMALFTWTEFVLCSQCMAVLLPIQALVLGTESFMEMFRFVLAGQCLRFRRWFQSQFSFHLGIAKMNLQKVGGKCILC